MNLGFLTSLECLRCGHAVAPDPEAYICPHCASRNGDSAGILDARYDYDRAAAALLDGSGIRSSRRDVFRYLPLLPLDQPGDVLPAGGTPLFSVPRIAKRLRMKALYIKDERRNPTLCLKDRATAVALPLAEATGHNEVYCASAGNAAISLAAFAAHRGLRCHVFLPGSVSETRLSWLRRFRAEIHLSEGNYDQAFEEAEASAKQHGWYSRNCAFNPFLVEGKKTAALEIGEDLDWKVPDYVIAPVGDGCTLGAIGKGFRELILLGLTNRVPRLIGAQSEGIQPVVESYFDRAWSSSGDTRAASIAVRSPRNVRRVLNEVRDSDGMMVAISDDATAAAQSELGHVAGLASEFTSATTLAALNQLAGEGGLDGATAVLVLTGGRIDAEDTVPATTHSAAGHDQASAAR